MNGLPVTVKRKIQMKTVQAFRSFAQSFEYSTMRFHRQCKNKTYVAHQTNSGRERRLTFDRDGSCHKTNRFFFGPSIGTQPTAPRQATVRKVCACISVARQDLLQDTVALGAVPSTGKKTEPSQ